MTDTNDLYASLDERLVLAPYAREWSRVELVKGYPTLLVCCTVWSDRLDTGELTVHLEVRSGRSHWKRLSGGSNALPCGYSRLAFPIELPQRRRHFVRLHYVAGPCRVVVSSGIRKVAAR